MDKKLNLQPYLEETAEWFKRESEKQADLLAKMNALIKKDPNHDPAKYKPIPFNIKEEPQ